MQTVWTNLYFLFTCMKRPLNLILTCKICNRMYLQPINLIEQDIIKTIFLSWYLPYVFNSRSFYVFVKSFLMHADCRIKKVSLDMFISWKSILLHLLLFLSIFCTKTGAQNKIRNWFKNIDVSIIYYEKVLMIVIPFMNAAPFYFDPFLNCGAIWFFFIVKMVE